MWDLIRRSLNWGWAIILTIVGAVILILIWCRPTKSAKVGTDKKPNAPISPVLDDLYSVVLEKAGLAKAEAVAKSTEDKANLAEIKAIPEGVERRRRLAKYLNDRH